MRSLHGYFDSKPIRLSVVVASVVVLVYTMSWLCFDWRKSQAAIRDIGRYGVCSETRLDASGTDIPTEILQRALPHLPALSSINLDNNTALSASAFSDWSPSSTLQTLRISNTSIVFDSELICGKMRLATGLRTLSLSHTKATNAHLTCFFNCSRLEFVDLTGTHVTEVAPALSAWPQVVEIYLADSKVTNEDIIKWPSMPYTKSIDVSGIPLQVTAVEHIVTHSKVEYLYVRSLPIVIDKDFAQAIARSDTLRVLDTKNCRMTAPDVLQVLIDNVHITLIDASGVTFDDGRSLSANSIRLRPGLQLVIK